MRTRLFLIAAAIAAVLTLLGGTANAAVLSVVPAKVTASQDHLTVLELRLNSEQQVVNAVEGKLTYDPAELEVVAVSKAGSFLTLWAAGPTVDATAGSVSFVGGVPNGSYVVNGRVLSIVFRPKALGATVVALDSVTSSVRLNDGLGTAVPLRTEASALTIGVDDSPFGLTSSTHPDENTWYASKDVQLAWTPTTGAVYAFLLTDDPAALPDERFGTAVAEASYADVADGVHYFVLRERLPSDVWRTVAIRRVLVDTIAPEAFVPVVTKDVVPNTLALVFQANDLTSEIVRYVVQEGNVVTDNVTSPYVLKDQRHRQSITVQAFDSAGNVTTATVPAAPVSGTAIPVLPVIAIALLLLGGVLVAAWKWRR